MADSTRMPEDVLFADLQKLVQLGDPVLHIHGFAAQGSKLSKVEVNGDKPIEDLR
jgi:hypothetical protein